MRRFQLIRDKDATGVSGVGHVADGVQFDDGNVCIRWRSGTPSTVIWASVEDAVSIHGHNGWTAVRWIDTSSSTLLAA